MDETTGSGMAKLKGIFEATVSHLIFLIKNVLVPRTSHIEGFHDLTKFLPVLDLSSKSINIPSLLMNSTKDFQGKIYKHLPGCKENHFSSLSFGQAEASIYQPRCRFNQPQKRFDKQNRLTILLLFEFLKKYHLPVGQFKNIIHQPDSKIHQPQAIGHYFLCTLHISTLFLKVSNFPETLPNIYIFSF